LVGSLLPAIDFLSRMPKGRLWPIGLLGIAASLLAVFTPALITGEASDLRLGEGASLCTAPLLARLWTWRDRTGRWDVLDPLVIACAPFAVLSIVPLIGRLFEPGILSWD
jgi:hypothetical protein